MCEGPLPLMWNEHGERVDQMISTSDASVDDIPRVMREHRDLRKALDKALKMLEATGFAPESDRDRAELEWIIKVRKQNPL